MRAAIDAHELIVENGSERAARGCPVGDAYLPLADTPEIQRLVFGGGGDDETGGDGPREIADFSMDVGGVQVIIPGGRKDIAPAQDSRRRPERSVRLTNARNAAIASGSGAATVAGRDRKPRQSSGQRLRGGRDGRPKQRKRNQDKGRPGRRQATRSAFRWKFCGACGDALNATQKFCGECGHGRR